MRQASKACTDALECLALVLDVRLDDVVNVDDAASSVTVVVPAVVNTESVWVSLLKAEGASARLLLLVDEGLSEPAGWKAAFNGEPYRGIADCVNDIACTIRCVEGSVTTIAGRGSSTHVEVLADADTTGAKELDQYCVLVGPLREVRS